MVLVPSLVLVSACGGSSAGVTSTTEYDPDVARYRLLLRENPVASQNRF